MEINDFLKKKWPEILGILGFSYWLVITIFYYNYITVFCLGGLTILLPTVLLSYRRRNRGQRKVILRRRLITTGFVLGFIIFALFANVFRVPSQIITRLDRTKVLITPENEYVLQFRQDLFDAAGGETAFKNRDLRTQLDILDYYTQKKIVWTPDLEFRLMAGDAATPEEAIRAGKDDCRGQACTMASVLISMGINAWVVEMPWHWWVKVYDANGVEYILNRDGSRNSTGDYIDIMMWNNEEIRYLVDGPIGVYHASMVSSRQFYKQLGIFVYILPILLGIGGAIYSSTCQGDLKLIMKKDKGARRRFRRRFLYSLMGFCALFGILLILYFTPLIEFIAFYLFIYGTAAIITILNLEEINVRIRDR